MSAIAFPRSPFWDFSLRLYARPGVADACLRLQERRGIDVNLLFYGLWLGMEGERLSRSDIVAAMTRVRTLHEQVVKPLRTARTALKRMIDGDPALSPAIGALRTAIKKSELDAEHLEQVMLGAVLPRRATGSPSVALARANAAVYLAAIGVRAGPADESDLDRIVAALPTPGSAKLNGATPPKPARKRPLARPGQGRTI
jgi:uncharacterized protein (TIGR02444 family)